MNLLDPKAYYLIVSSHSDLNDDYTNNILSSRLEDRLYRNEFKIVPFKKKGGGKSFLAFKENCEDNNMLRYEAIEINDLFYQDYCYVKYFEEDTIKKILKNGSEVNTKLTNYNNEENEITFFNENMAFSLIDLQKYYIPKKKSDIKQGMVVEIMNNKGHWIPRKVENIDNEWEKMYKLLVRYEKIRILDNLDLKI